MLTNTENPYSSINYLSDQECKIHSWRNSLLNGTKKEVELSFKQEDISLDYKTIHRQYLSILKTTENENIKLEVLKRLIFLNWKSIVEPEWLTGIVELDETAIDDSYGILNSYIKTGPIDNELKWMLEYYSVWDWVILNYSEDKKELSLFVNSVKSVRGSLPNKLPKGNMDNRGQMGIFWKSIIE